MIGLGCCLIRILLFIAFSKESAGFRILPIELKKKLFLWHNTLDRPCSTEKPNAVIDHCCSVPLLFKLEMKPYNTHTFPYE